MPASNEMESSFSFPVLEPACPQAAHNAEASIDGGAKGAPVSRLMHARRYAVTAIGLDARRATAEGAENQDRGNEGE